MHLILKPSTLPHSLVLWVGLLWNSHQFPVSFFDFMVLFFSYVFDELSWVALFWLCPWFCNLGKPFPCFRFADPKSRFFFLNLYSILTAIGTSCRARRCSGTPSHLGCTGVGSCGTLVPNAAQSPWYLVVCEGYEIFLWTRAHLGPFPVVAWSTLCICPHRFWQSSIAPWLHPRMNSKWVWLKIVSPYFHPSTRSRFPTNPWCGGLLWEERR